MSTGMRNLIIALGVGVLIAVLAIRFGLPDNEVRIEAPTEAERAAEMEKMTPEQREAAEAMLNAVRAQAQAEAEARKPAE
jgi:hypothetical protein